MTQVHCATPTFRKAYTREWVAPPVDAYRPYETHVRLTTSMQFPR